ncbi:TIGR03862 family flavoprotein [Litoreibacter arenae]|uniref:NAD(FAD)-utilizing dehydrogenase n=1 Tax=Litoreibacter arenae DSM 19593 TaxID=1123360 RepID=S9QDX0_9RHOB|nr:TIGR03862 family flavoprotein [Litoreibacter arenae]EPX77798.1 NAD(FAD)-utilizing dehydrogenase [Litoreibacter arenae DSM 19593]
MSDALVIGGGPAGLMAAEMLADAGLSVTVAEQKPSIGRKFLMAGKSGLNLTKDEPEAKFFDAYKSDWLLPALREFGPVEVMAWAEDLEQPIFTGSSGRVFPKAMKASPLLRAWLARLAGKGVTFQTRWRWTGWRREASVFDTQEGVVEVAPAVTILAMGGASWRRLGSDGAWSEHFTADALHPFKPANMGLVVNWSSHMADHLGEPLKNIATCAGGEAIRGEAVVSAKGLEGGGIYAVSAAVRDGADLTIDLLPDLAAIEIEKRLRRRRGKNSLANHMRKNLKLEPVKLALLQEFARPLPDDPADLAALIKALPVHHEGPRPLDEAISTAGGLAASALDKNLMLRDRPGVFAAGEMLDWEAPTGGYLITGCLATGRWAGRAAAAYASRPSVQSAR